MPMQTTKRTPATAYLSIIFALLIPPVGLILGIVAWRKTKKQNLPGATTAQAGVLIGALFSIPFIYVLILLNPLSELGGNQAQKLSTDFTTVIEKWGATQICKSGDSGKGWDNQIPWYNVYYQVPDSQSLVRDIVAESNRMGYRPSNRPGVDNITDYTKDIELVNQSTGANLHVTINRNTTVALECDTGGYGRIQQTDKGKAILLISFSMPQP